MPDISGIAEIFRTPAAEISSSIGLDCIVTWRLEYFTYGV